MIGTFVKYSHNLADEYQDPNERAILAVVAASIATRSSAKIAFDSKQIGLTTPDIIQVIPAYLAQYYLEDLPFNKL